ncbi:MAG: M24 family metallopeptidase, partial [Candidatus Methanomethylicaceae archaeon]
DIRVFSTSEELAGMLADLTRRQRHTVLRMGVVQMAIMPFEEAKLLFERLGGISFCDASDLFNRVRWRKSSEELKLITATANIIDKAFERLLEAVRPGVDEGQVIGEAMKVMAQCNVEDTIILTAKGPAFCGYLARPSPYKFSPGDKYIVSIEAAGPAGYWSQMVRVIMLGPADDAYSELIRIAEEVLKVGIECLVPNKTIADVASSMMVKAKERGVEIAPWMGHGMGLDLGEGVDVIPNNRLTLTEGMVITLHPHIWFPGTEKGVTIGDTFAVTSSGPQKLSSTKLQAFLV